MAFNFGSSAAGGSNTPNKPLFGASSSGGPPSLFSSAGNTANPGPGASGGSIFGGTGSNTALSTPFGGTSNASAANKPAGSLFGNKPSGGLFGGPQSTSTPSQPTPSPLSFGTAAAGAASKPSLFGNAGNTSSTSATLGGTTAAGTPTFSFGTTGSSTPSSTPAATPAPTKTISLPSTTPAGPPPGTSLFGAQPSQSGTGTGASSGTSSLFSGLNKPATTSASSTSNLFGTTPSASATPKPPGGATGGSGLSFFGKTDAQSDVNKSTTAQPSTTPSTLFGGAAQSGTQGAQSTPTLFSNLSSTTPASTPANKAPSFGLGTTPAPAPPASSQPSTSSGTILGLGGTPANPAPPSASTGLFAPKNPASGGSGIGTTGDLSFSTTSGAAPAATTTTTSGAGGAGTPASSATATSSAAAPSSIFGLGSKPAAPASQPPTSTTSATTATAATTPGGAKASSDAAKSGLAGSTAGPAPSAQSRLKNKSMDEIITRWAADLSKYQKEFQQQAETVAKWDRALVENSDKVKQLYSKTFQAERDAAEVERQLTMMEENQQELDSYLDRYEKEIENMMKLHGVGGRSDGLRGPDQERERTYKLAEKLQDRLNELNKDLTEMIEEINSTSQTLTKTGKPDDPLTKVVRVLNSQLSQLQVIESGAAQLQEKIDKAQKESQRVGTNGWNGLGTDPAEDFYRSFRGGRTDRFGGVS